MFCILCGISRLVYSLFAEACSQDALAPQSHLALEPPIGSCSRIPCSCPAKVCDGEEDPSQRIHKSDPQDISRYTQIAPDIPRYLQLSQQHQPLLDAEAGGASSTGGLGLRRCHGASHAERSATFQGAKCPDVPRDPGENGKVEYPQRTI